MKVSLLFASAMFLGSCQPTTADTEEPTSPPVAKARGIESITAAALRKDVEYLASEELNGRETGTGGARAAAHYLAGHFAELGLKPLVGQTDFFVPYTLMDLGVDKTNTMVAVSVGGKAEKLKIGQDVRPFYFGDAGSAVAEVVFAGYGITAPKLKYDDYEGLDVKGKWVLVLRHHPNEDNKQLGFSQTRHAAFLAKAKTAQAHGAIGMLLVTDPKHHKKDDDLRTGRRLARPPPADAQIVASPPKKGLPFFALHISQAVAQKLAQSSGHTLLALQEAVDTGKQSSAFSLAGVSVDVRIKKNIEPRRIIEHNVIAVLEGADPALKDQWVVVGAHYDHLGGYIGEGDTVYNGADDNASGTSGMLALARAFATAEVRPARSIVFVGFSGEEKGLLGSKAAVAEKTLPPEKIAFMLNLDMIGRADAGKISVIGDGYSTGIKEIVQAANKNVGLPLAMGGQAYSGSSDHHPFYSNDVPFLFFFTGLHKDYHQLSDHPDKLIYDRMEKIVRVVYGVVDGVASSKQPPRFVHHITWLGVTTQVVGDAAEITAVQKDSRADRVGIKIGDVVTSFDGAALDRASAIGRAFRAIKPGTEFELGLARAGVTKNVKITRSKRGYLGVYPGGVAEDKRKALGLGSREGVLIRGLSDDGPAGKSGIKKDDILIRIAGVAVGMGSLGQLLARIGANETVDIVVIRDGKRIPLKLTLGARPSR